LSIQLVVIHVFASYQVGDHITDPALVAKWGASHPEYVVRKSYEESEPSVSTSPESPTVPTLKPIA